MIRLLTVCVLLFTACKKEEEAPKATDKPSTTAPTPAPTAPSDKPGETAQATPTGTATAANPGGAAAITCAEVVPKEVQEKYFAGMELKEEPSPNGISCTFINASTGDIAIYSPYCVTWDEETFKMTMDIGRGAMDGAKDVPGVGKQAFAGTVGGMAMLQFRDDDTNCYATLAAPEAKLTEIAKALVTALEPGDLK